IIVLEGKVIEIMDRWGCCVLLSHRDESQSEKRQREDAADPPIVHSNSSSCARTPTCAVPNYNLLTAPVCCSQAQLDVRSYDTSKMHAMMKLRRIQMSAPRAL